MATGGKGRACFPGEPRPCEPPACAGAGSGVGPIRAGAGGRGAAGWGGAQSPYAGLSRGQACGDWK